MEIHEAASDFDRDWSRRLPAHRELRDHRRPAHHGPGGDGWFHRLAVPARTTTPASSRPSSTVRKGGRFKISPVGGEVTTKQLYWPDTNVLVTRFFTPDGVGEVTDYMPIGASAEGRHRIIRRVEVVRGTMTFRMECTRPSITPPSMRPGSPRRGDLRLLPSQPGTGVVHPLTARGRRILRRVHASRGTVHGIRAQGDRRWGRLRGVSLHDGGRRDLHADRQHGAAGSPNAPTRAAGARWYAARP